MATGPALFAAQQSGQVHAWRAGVWSFVGAPSFGSSFGAALSSLAVMDDGAGAKLYVGGDFDLAGALPVERVARWDGSTWSSVGDTAGADGLVAALAVAHLPGRTAPSLFVGGTFNRLGNDFSNRIGEWVGCPVAATEGSDRTRAR
jgi:hypothetical protein